MVSAVLARLFTPDRSDMRPFPWGILVPRWGGSACLFRTKRVRRSLSQLVSGMCDRRRYAPPTFHEVAPLQLPYVGLDRQRQRPSLTRCAASLRSACARRSRADSKAHKEIEATLARGRPTSWRVRAPCVSRYSLSERGSYHGGPGVQSLRSGYAGLAWRQHAPFLHSRPSRGHRVRTQPCITQGAASAPRARARPWRVAVHWDAVSRLRRLRP